MPTHLLHDLRQLLVTSQPAELGPERREGTLSIPQVDSALEAALKPSRASASARDLLRATIYLWHDHLEVSHRIAQNLETPDGSLVHAIMHRREPDYPNSKYWFRRVGAHPAFLELAVLGGAFLEKANESDLHGRLVPNRTWDPFAFVDAVEDAEKGRFKSKKAILREVQRLEFESLIGNFAHRV